jgi:hypothetical protein
MATTTTTSTKTKGGEFLIKETNAQDIFIPEQWNEEQLMMKQSWSIRFTRSFGS